jgi:Tfp pilus assembly protein FimT
VVLPFSINEENAVKAKWRTGVTVKVSQLINRKSDIKAKQQTSLFFSLSNQSQQNNNNATLMHDPSHINKYDTTARHKTITVIT